MAVQIVASAEVWAEGGAPLQEIAREYGIARSRQYELIARGELVSILLGRRRIVARRSARLYLEKVHREQTG